MAMCELLLDRGADIDAKCSWGSPSLWETRGGGPQHMPPARNTPWKIKGWFTYSHHPFRKENDLNQTSMRTCSMLIFQGVRPYQGTINHHCALFRALSMALYFLGVGGWHWKAPEIPRTNHQV